jgi:hypothetical protein
MTPIPCRRCGTALERGPRMAGKSLRWYCPNAACTTHASAPAWKPDPMCSRCCSPATCQAGHLHLCATCCPSPHAHGAQKKGAI